LAEPVRLETTLPLGAMLRLLTAAPELSTSTLVCLAGRWRDGTVLIGWDPVAELSRLDELDARDAGGRWIGWLDYAGGCWFGRFPTVLTGSSAGGWWWHGAAEGAMLIDDLALRAAPSLLEQPGSVRFGELVATGRGTHLAAVEHAIAAIRAGQLYQANICARLSGTIAGEPLELFVRGVEQLAPDYAAFIRTPSRTAVSLSPELFLDRRGSSVSSAPIKGTRPRTALDPDAAAELLHSRKDRAENVMIVDLVRNDLSRVCATGTVKVDRLLEVRPAPGVWHLVSQVSGRLATSSTGSLLEATFPPGSVTGAPKLRARRLIAELEQADRGLFTGAVGYVEQDANQSGTRSEFNVAIRTFEIAAGRFELGVGGGITADSVPVAEWQECQDKAAPLLALGATQWSDPTVDVPECIDTTRGIFDTMLAVGGQLIAPADHLSRLEASCLEIFGCYLPGDLPARLHAAVAGTCGRHRVRVTVLPDASFRIETAAAGPAGGRVSLFRAERPAGLWRHKWADRDWLARYPSTADAQPVFAAADGSVAETGIANLVTIPSAGVLRTPELSSDILPGVSRRRFLDAALDDGWRVELGPVGFDELAGSRLVLALSSIRGVAIVDRLDGVPLEVADGLLGRLAGG
jgi:para-aminobenzoate synthetase/4-amino-4-deoxychorismate lyase